jgi:hypothetical protein
MDYDLPEIEIYGVYDMAVLSETYNNSQDPIEKYDIVSKAITCDIAEIRRLFPGMDLENPRMYSDIKQYALVQKSAKEELLDIFNFNSEDAYYALAHYNVMTFLHIAKNHLGNKLDQNPEFVGRITQEYNKHKDDISFNKLVCLFPYCKIEDKKICELIYKEIN